MLLRSFSFGSWYGHSELPEEVLGLFTEGTCQYDYEIIVAALQGKINFNDFTMGKYETTVRKNLLLDKSRRTKKQVSIDNADDEEDYTGNITMDKVSHQESLKMEDAYSKIEDDEELAYAVSTIKSLRNDLLIDEGVDILALLDSALNCVQSSVEKLKELCSNYTIVSELITTILKSGYTYDELFASC